MFYPADIVNIVCEGVSLQVCKFDIMRGDILTFCVIKRKIVGRIIYIVLKGWIMGNKDIFISYKSEEFDDALWVKNRLEESGISCWMAPMCITGGASYATEIPIAIQNCKVFVLILSDVVQESKWVPRELDQAINADKLIMPFMIKNCTLNDEFSFYLSNVQRYVAYIDREEALMKMIAEIKNYLGINEPIINEPTTNVPTTNEPEKIVEISNTQNTQTVKPKAIKEKTKNKTTATKKPNNKKRGVITVLCAVVAFIVAVSGCVIAINAKNKIVIAGVTYKKSNYSITIEDKKIHPEDLSKLTEFEDLSFVKFKKCVFKTDDLKVLAELDLLELELSDCGLTDAQLNSIEFDAFEKLSSLNLNGNDKITDLSVIAPIADTAEELYFNTIAVENFDWLNNFANLKQIYMNDTGIDNLDCILNMPYLEVLSADNNAIKSLEGLKNTSLLSIVSLANNQITDISLLANSAAKLNNINLDNNKIADASALSECVKLRQISFNNNQINSVSWTKELKEITSLSLANNNIETLDGITQSATLTTLNISKNKLTEVSELFFADDSYVNVDFRDNQITTLQIPKNCNYSTLALNGNPLQNSEFLSKTNGFKISFDYFESLDTESLKESQFSSIYIVDCPKNRIVETEKAHYGVRFVSAEEIENLMYN